jgi:hypothetical protein
MTESNARYSLVDHKDWYARLRGFHIETITHDSGILGNRITARCPDCLDCEMKPSNSDPLLETSNDVKTSQLDRALANELRFLKRVNKAATTFLTCLIARWLQEINLVKKQLYRGSIRNWAPG